MSSYLEMSYRHGRPFAAYLHFKSSPVQACSCRELPYGLILDLDADQHPIGLEITAPGVCTAEQILAVVLGLGVDCRPEDLAPLAA